MVSCVKPPASFFPTKLSRLRIGFLVCVQKLLRVRRGGLCFSGLPCSSHVWISRGSTGRSRDCPRGNLQSSTTQAGNEQACRFSLLVLVCVARMVYWVCEQPSSSLAIYLPYIEWVLNLNRINPGLIPGRVVRLWLGIFFYKTLVFWQL